MASQVAFGLYARSAVTAAAVDAARRVADAPGPAATAQAEATARRALGAYGRTTTFVWAVSANVVQLTVGFHVRSFVPGFDHFSRTVRSRIEHVE
jgi:uncharacterized membrane protein (DUF4010 family)